MLAFFLEPVEMFPFAVAESPYRLGVEDERQRAQHKHDDDAAISYSRRPPTMIHFIMNHRSPRSWRDRSPYATVPQVYGPAARL